MRIERGTLDKFKCSETDSRAAVLTDKQDYTYTLTILLYLILLRGGSNIDSFDVSVSESEVYHFLGN